MKKDDQIIDKGPVVFLFISFGLYGLTTIFMIPVSLGKVSSAYFWFNLVFFQTSYLISCVTLAVIVYRLLLIQCAQED